MGPKNNNVSAMFLLRYDFVLGIRPQVYELYLSEITNFFKQYPHRTCINVFICLSLVLGRCKLITSSQLKQFCEKITMSYRCKLQGTQAFLNNNVGCVFYMLVLSYFLIRLKKAISPDMNFIYFYQAHVLHSTPKIASNQTGSTNQGWCDGAVAGKVGNLPSIKARTQISYP